MLVYVMCGVACVVAYLLCGIPSAYLVGERIAHVDVRKVGSGNVGSTNVVRAAGAKAGAITLLLDICKAAASIGIGYLLVGCIGTGAGISQVVPGAVFDWTMALVYLSCVLGHVFTPYLHFKGGKGIAVGFGGALALMPPVAASLLVPFLVFAVTTRYVSLGSIAAAVSLPFLTVLISRPSAAFTAIVAIVALLVVWAHRKNIAKLAKGTESKFSFKRSKGGE